MKAIILLLLLSFSIEVYSHSPEKESLVDGRELKVELGKLRKDIHRLESLVRDLTYLVENGNSHRLPEKRENSWGCYMDDLTVGGLYAVGRTEAEARGKALERCTQKKGVCWDSKLKCSKEE